MQNLRSIALGISGIAVLALAAAFTVSLTLVAGTVLALSLAARMLGPKTKAAPVYAKARTRTDDMRIWNDGRGTIIDL